MHKSYNHFLNSLNNPQLLSFLPVGELPSLSSAAAALVDPSSTSRPLPFPSPLPGCAVDLNGLGLSPFEAGEPDRETVVSSPAMSAQTKASTHS